MEATFSTEMTAHFYQITSYHIPEDDNRHFSRHLTLKSRGRLISHQFTYTVFWHMTLAFSSFP
jgi:hypothetical protein